LESFEKTDVLIVVLKVRFAECVFFLTNIKFEFDQKPRSDVMLNY